MASPGVVRNLRSLLVKLLIHLRFIVITPSPRHLTNMAQLPKLLSGCVWHLECIR